MNCGQKMLKDKECFYDRPAHELIFLTRKEHARIHAIGNTNTLGKPSKQKGKHLSNDIKKKISLTLTGRKCPEHSEIMQKKRWFNNGVTSVMCEECPEGYVAGRGSCFNRA